MPPAVIYLDHNATTPILPEVAEAVREASLRYGGNPESQHEPGRQARRALETARESIAAILGARTGGREPDRVVFTSGGTEANNLALCGLLGLDSLHSMRVAAWRDDGPEPAPSALAQRQRPHRPEEPCLLISAIEHPSIARTAEQLARWGCRVDTLPVDENGMIKIAELEELLPQALPIAGKRAPGSPPMPFRQRRAVVSVMLASNETGVIQPLAEVGRLSGRRGVLTHTDATQAVGKIAVNFQKLAVEALTATAHKFHGPLGIGVLVVRHGVELHPSLFGGFQQAGLRPGTESVSLAAGMQKALELWQHEAESREARMGALRDRLERALVEGYPQAVVIGAAAPRLPQTSNIAFRGLDRQALVMAIDLAGVACSTGSACASGSSEPSPALVAMGLPQEQISSSLRLSLGATTTDEEVAEAARRILAVCNRLGREK